MIEINIPPKLEEALIKAAQEQNISLATLVIRAFEGYLEDYEDYKLAYSRLEEVNSGEEETISLEEMIREFEDQ